MANIEDLKQYKRIHMIGIGGVSMSGIAEILKNWGFIITGSDCSASENTDKLLQNRIPVTIGHDLNNLEKSDLVIYSAAIKADNIELVRAKELNIPVIERGSFLGKLTKAFRNSICISGTHGKTTTTSMVSMMGTFEPVITKHFCHILFLWILFSRNSNYIMSILLFSQKQVPVLIKAMLQKAASSHIPVALLHPYHITGQYLYTVCDFFVLKRAEFFSFLINLFHHWP